MDRPLVTPARVAVVLGFAVLLALLLQQRRQLAALEQRLTAPAAPATVYVPVPAVQAAAPDPRVEAPSKAAPAPSAAAAPLPPEVIKQVRVEASAWTKVLEGGLAGGAAADWSVIEGAAAAREARARALFPGDPDPIARLKGVEASMGGTPLKVQGPGREYEATRLP